MKSSLCGHQRQKQMQNKMATLHLTPGPFSARNFLSFFSPCKPMCLPVGMPSTFKIVTT